jgi:hypothetical protein
MEEPFVGQLFVVVEAMKAERWAGTLITGTMRRKHKGGSRARLRPGDRLTFVGADEDRRKAAYRFAVEQLGRPFEVRMTPKEAKENLRPLPS